MSRHRVTDGTPADETSLIRQAQAGNQDASTALWARYADKVQHYIQIQRYGANHEDGKIEEIEAEDIEAIVQGTWQDIQQRFSLYGPAHTSFAALVEYCTTFVMLRYYTTPKRRERHDLLIETLSRELQTAHTAFQPDEACAELLLILHAQRGDAEAFKKLWDKNQEAIMGCIKARVRPSADAKTSETIANEIFNETYIALSQAVQKSYDPNIGRFLPFARGWAKNLVLRYWLFGNSRDS